MTDLDIMKLARDALEADEQDMVPDQEGHMVFRKGAAITALRERLAQPEQEPVAYINVEQRKLEWAKYMSWDTPTVVTLPKIPLYTTPPQRTWVGLTDEEVEYFVSKLWPVGAGAGKLFRAIEAKLKERNT